MGRLSLDASLVTDKAVVQELGTHDAELLAEAGPNIIVVRGRLGAPTSSGDAIAMFSDWEGLRETGQGDLFVLLACAAAVIWTRYKQTHPGEPAVAAT